MFKTLRFRILFYILLVSLSGIVFVSLSIQWGFESSFVNYLNQDREKKINRIKQEIVAEYKKTGEFKNNQIFNYMHEQAMIEKLFYKVFDIEGGLQVDSTSMINMMEQMGMQPSNQDKKLHSTLYPIMIDNKKIGTIEAFYPLGMVDEEFVFLETIKRYIIVAVGLTIVLSLLFSILFSKKLTSGFNRLSQAVKEIQNHNLNVRVPVENLSEEMKLLGTSFNNLAESLSREELLRKQFTGDLAHELRTPLATLRSQIEAYQDGVWEPTQKRLQQSHDELMRLVRLVNELEKLLSAENPQIQLHKTEIETGKILALIENQFKPSFNKRGVKLNIKKTDKEYYLCADHDRLIQILTNIIQNALNYTPSGKSVTVSIKEMEHYVGFIIKDEGIGIAKEDLPFIFHRFYRGDKSRARKTGGIGIGLSIVKALVDAHDAIIKIDSTQNAGTTVSILFQKGTNI
ncbi:HAMP domain-containing histidine kinase [Bacillus sp. Bva_UNVM-123]|uniref:ATP-binding protein n=1 Tax=Bacillus sp. Bva_UNVM-123 TaxID=2829798 RepID=UPI00391F2D7F